MVRSKKLIAFAAVAALALAACGSDEPAATDTTVADDAAAETTAAPDTAAEETADTAADDTVADEEMTDEEMADDTVAEEEMTDEAAGGAEYVIDTSACADPDAATAEFGDTIKIGTSIPQSGSTAVLFAPIADGMKAFIEYYNANGGVDGRMLELIIKDDQYAADQTVTNIEELVFDEGVNVIAGTLGTDNNLAIQELLNEECVPQLWETASGRGLVSVDELPWSTTMLVPYELEARLWADYVATNIGEGATVGLYYTNSEFGLTYADAFKDLAPEYGLEVVADETIADGDGAAPTGQLTNLVAANPDAILAAPLGTQCISFMTELGNQKAANPDFNPLVYQSGTCYNKIFFGAVTNGGTDGIYTHLNVMDIDNPKYADNPGVVAYLDAFAASGSEADPSGLALTGWSVMENTAHLFEVAAANGNLSREGVMNAARNIDFSASLLRAGLSFHMDANDGFAAEGTQVLQWSDAEGGFVEIGDVVSFEGVLGTSG